MSEGRNAGESIGSVDQQKPDRVGLQDQRQMARTVNASGRCLRSHPARKEPTRSSEFRAPGDQRTAHGSEDFVSPRGRHNFILSTLPYKDRFHLGEKQGEEEI